MKVERTKESEGKKEKEAEVEDKAADTILEKFATSDNQVSHFKGPLL
jgi:hypothetical protein